MEVEGKIISGSNASTVHAEKETPIKGAKRR
jgi:hypothetical protein